MSGVRSSFVALAIALAGCTGTEVSAQAPKRGGHLNYAVVTDPPNYDCHAQLTFGHLHPIAPHYSLLIKFDGKNYPQMIGDLAKSWEVSADQMTYTFRLHDNVKFHDGSPFSSADIKASYERIKDPPEGVVSLRKSYYQSIGSIVTPDAGTVVFKLKSPTAAFLEALASPWNCIYSARKLKENPKYPETEIMGTGAFTFVKHEKGSSWEGKRFDAYFKPGQPYLDSYKAFFVKSNAVVPGLLGDQFDSEFRGRSPAERDQLLSKAKDKFTVMEDRWLSNLLIFFNTKKKPFDDVRVRQALTLAIDRWGGSEQLAKISLLKYVGGLLRPGYAMGLPEEELVKLPGFGKDIEKSRAEARRLLKEAGVENLSFKLLNRTIDQPYTFGGVFLIDQWKRIGVTAEHHQLETKQYVGNASAGNFEVLIEFIADYVDDPTIQFAKITTKKLSPVALADHDDKKIDELYEQQRITMNVAERTKIVREMERHALQQAYAVPLLWWQRIIVQHKKIRNWHIMPNHYLGQDLSDVWLDQ